LLSFSPLTRNSLIKAKEFVTIIANESHRMSRMINTFLAVAQLERKDRQEVLKIPLRLDDVVRDTILNLQPTAKKKTNQANRTAESAHPACGC
jgi:signal transduction histidine kinase